MTAEEAPKIEEVEATDDAGAGKRHIRVSVSSVVWGAGVVASVALFVALGLTFAWPHWPGRDSDASAAESVVSAAKDGTAAVYTYSAETIDRDIASAQSHLTGDFLSEYRQYVQSPAPTQLKQNSVKTVATVVGSALMELRRGSADVLLFINQTTTSAQNPATTMASRSIVATLVKVDDKWLISSLKPV